VVIIFGSREEGMVVERFPARHCPACQQEQPHAVVLRYKYDHLYYIFCFTRWRKYRLVCEVCRREDKLERRGYERSLGRNPVPFLRRAGCLMIPLVFGVALCLTCALSSLIG
jgi:hypothetical protein